MPETHFNVDITASAVETISHLRLSLRVCTYTDGEGPYNYRIS